LMNNSGHRKTSSSSLYLPYTDSSPFASSSTSAHTVTHTNVHVYPRPDLPYYHLNNLPSIQIPNNPYSYPHLPYEPGLSSSSSRPDPNAAYGRTLEASHSPYAHTQAQVFQPSYLDERTLRSPHPPLTASYHPSHLWPRPIEANHRTPSFYTSPLDFPGVNVPGDSTYRSSPLGPAPPFLPPLLRNSPVLIPPPLQFKYSASPDMPPRKKPALGSSKATPCTPQTVSSSSSRWKVAKGNGWTLEQTYDSIGQKKEVIVIDDSESPGKIPRKRTRAQVKAESALANGHANGSSSLAGSAKKRKAEEASDAGSVKKAKAKVVSECYEQADNRSRHSPKHLSHHPVHRQIHHGTIQRAITS